MTLAQAVYVLFGFGAGLITVGIMALFMADVTDVVTLLLLVNLPAEAVIVGRARKAIQWNGVILISGGIAAGVVLGTQILRQVDATLALTILGSVLVAAGAAFLLLRRSHRAVRWPAWSQPPIGLLSGTLSGLFGTGGPPLIIYYQLAEAPKATFRGNLMAIFLLTSAVRLPAYGVAGLITWPRLWSAAALLPAALLGAWIGNRIHVELPEARFRRLVSVALVIIGLLLISRALS